EESLWYPDIDDIKSKITVPEYLNNILAFIGTPLFNDICEADAIYQEKVFFMPVNTSYISAYTDDKYQSEHEVLLQGVIDCLIIKDGYATIVDYKTDKVEKGNEKEHALRYIKQLDIYSEAVERIMGIKVTRKIIHFFETNTNVELNLL
ncbi:MAG TPA: PD-(D/E)XK nuclease family protein, partial [Clostridia bacterium]|nr:PD-(D/E)XK nuclease family protein [Clostridia bacterium]